MLRAISEINTNGTNKTIEKQTPKQDESEENNLQRK